VLAIKHLALKASYSFYRLKFWALWMEHSGHNFGCQWSRMLRR